MVMIMMMMMIFNDEEYHGDKESNALGEKVDGDHDYKDAATSGQVIVILAAKICSMKFRKITGKFWFT